MEGIKRKNAEINKPSSRKTLKLVFKKYDLKK